MGYKHLRLDNYKNDAIRNLQLSSFRLRPKSKNLSKQVAGIDPADEWQTTEISKLDGGDVSDGDLGKSHGLVDGAGGDEENLESMWSKNFKVSLIISSGQEVS